MISQRPKSREVVLDAPVAIDERTQKRNRAQQQRVKPRSADRG